jgi:hypothetical protein
MKQVADSIRTVMVAGDQHSSMFTPCRQHIAALIIHRKTAQPCCYCWPQRSQPHSPCQPHEDWQKLPDQYGSAVLLVEVGCATA